MYCRARSWLLGVWFTMHPMLLHNLLSSPQSLWRTWFSFLTEPLTWGWESCLCSMTHNLTSHDTVLSLLWFKFCSSVKSCVCLPSAYLRCFNLCVISVIPTSIMDVHVFTPQKWYISFPILMSVLMRLDLVVDTKAVF